MNNNNNNNIPKEPDFSWLFKDIKKEHPELKAGQLWTIFHPEIENEETDETETGQIVLIMEIEDNNVFIVPVHATESTRTILDPLISEECHNLHPYPIVAVVTMAQNLGKAPFETARFIGEMTKDGLEIVKECYNKYLNAIEELAIVQYKDTHDIELTDEEEAAATKAGIYKLCPVNGDIDSLIEFNNEISEILQPWHVLAMAEMFAEEEEEEKVPVVAEPEPAYGLFQKVASIIKIVFNDLALPDFLPAAAGEAEKVDHKIPLVVNIEGEEKEIDVVLKWDNIKKVTRVWLGGKNSEYFCNKKTAITIVFENGEKTSHIFDNNDNFELEIPLKNRPISHVFIKIAS